MKKLLAFISTTNQFLIFLAVLLFIVVAGKDLFRGFFEPSYQEPQVKIIEDAGEAKEEVQIKYETKFNMKLLDVYVFNLSSDAIKMKSGSNMDDTTLNMFSAGARKIFQKVNLLFVPKSGSSYLLMKDDGYIIKTSFYDDSKEKHRYKKKLSKNLYLVISKDENSDGFLNSDDDAADLYVSDYNGKNLKLILKGVENYELMQDNFIMIEAREKSGVTFYTYDLLTKELLKLDTKSPLTNG